MRNSFVNFLRGLSLNYHSAIIRPNIDLPVQNNLAVTPSKMLEMAQHGVPISTANDKAFFDGVKNPSWDIDIALDRRSDVNDVWKAERDSSMKLKKAHHSDIIKFGA